MKKNSTQALIIRIILFLLICLYSFLVFGQPVEILQVTATEIRHATEQQSGHFADEQHTTKPLRSLEGGLTLALTSTK